MMILDFEQMVNELQKVTNLTKKSSQKILLKSLFKSENIEIFDNIIKNIKRFNICDTCGTVCEKEQCLNCSIISEEIFLIENVDDYMFFKNFFTNSKFFVINFFSKKDYININKINDFIEKFNNFIDKFSITTVTILFSPSIKYEIIKSILKANIKNKNIIILKIGVGVSFDTDIKYFDQRTIRTSIENREKI